MKKVWNSPSIVSVEVSFTNGGKEGNSSEKSLNLTYPNYIDADGKYTGKINNGTGQGNNSAATAYNAWLVAKS